MLRSVTQWADTAAARDALLCRSLTRGTAVPRPPVSMHRAENTWQPHGPVLGVGRGVTQPLTQLTQAGGMSAEDKLLLKIRICNERPGGNKLLGRTATGLHCRSRLKSCMRNTWKSAIRKKQSLIFRGEKKGKGKHFMFQENEKRASTIGKCTNIYISPFLSS